MRKAIITDRNEARKARLLTSGIHFIRTADGLAMYLPMRYDARIDLDGLTYCMPGETSPFPELNTLIAQGLVKEERDFQEYEVFPEGFDNASSRTPLTGRRIRKIIEEFKEHGFNVTREAVIHNYKAWAMDYKSGFRDERNGYHLFTPCGCNSLRFSATTLCDDLNWQTTYEA